MDEEFEVLLEEASKTEKTKAEKSKKERKESLAKTTTRSKKSGKAE